MLYLIKKKQKMRIYNKNPPFKKTIAQEIKQKENAIKIPLKDEVKKLWWSKYNSKDLKNPESK